MKKFLLSATLVASLFANDKVLTPTKTLNVLKSTPFYEKLKSAIGKDIKIKGVENDSFYIIELDSKRGRGLLYITKDKKYTILGRVIDNNTGQMVIPHYPIDKNIVKKGISFTFGHGNKEIYVVTDPECPFCRMMEKKVGNELAKNYRVHVILYPLPFHKNAKAMSYYILAGKTDEERAKRFKETLQGGNEWKNYKPTPADKAQFDKELKASQKAVDNLGAQGTPTVYDENFNQLKNWGELLPKKDTK